MHSLVVSKCYCHHSPFGRKKTHILSRILVQLMMVQTNKGSKLHNSLHQRKQHTPSVPHVCAWPSDSHNLSKVWKLPLQQVFVNISAEVSYKHRKVVVRILASRSRESPVHPEVLWVNCRWMVTCMSHDHHMIITCTLYACVCTYICNAQYGEGLSALPR